MFSGHFWHDILGWHFFGEHNVKMTTAMYKMALQKHLKANMKMTGIML